MKNSKIFLAVLIIMVSVLMSSCGGKNKPIDNKPTTTPVLTAELTATPEPTAELTATPEPTAELTTTPEPTVEPTATPEPIIEVEYPVLNPHTEEELLAELDKIKFDEIIFVVWQNDYSVKFFTEGDVLLDEYYDFIYIYHPEDVLTINTSLDQYAELSQKSSKVHKNITGHYNLNTIEYNVNCETNGNKYEASVNLTINVPEYTETLN